MRRSRERCPARSWRVSQTRRWLAYWEVRRRPARAAARAPRGAAVRTGPKGGAKIPPGSRVREHFSPVRKNGPVQTKHRGGAPVGEAAPVWAAGSPSQVSPLKARHPALRSLSPVGESEEKTRRCAPASVERGGGALAFYPSPLWGGWTRALASGRVGRDHAQTFPHPPRRFAARHPPHKGEGKKAWLFDR